MSTFSAYGPPVEIKRLAEKYFGPIPAGPLPPRLVTKEPAQMGTKKLEIDETNGWRLISVYQHGYRLERAA